MNTTTSHINNELDQTRDLGLQARDGRDTQTCIGRRLKVSIKDAKGVTPQAKASVVLMCG